MRHSLNVSCRKMRTPAQWDPASPGTGGSKANENPLENYSHRQDRIHTAGLSPPPLWGKRMLFAGILATELFGIRLIHLYSWPAHTLISVACLNRKLSEPWQREKGAESGRAPCLLGLPVITSKWAEKPDNSVREAHQTPLCSQVQPSCLLSLALFVPTFQCLYLWKWTLDCGGYYCYYYYFKSTTFTV